MCVCYCVAATQSCEVQACFELVVHIHHTDGRTNGHLEVLSLLTEAEKREKEKERGKRERKKEWEKER